MGDLYDATKGKSLGFEKEIWWEGAIALARFDHDSLESVEIYPVDLGASLPRPQRGTPRLASPALSRKILERMARLSAPYGVHIRIEEGKGVVELASSTN